MFLLVADVNCRVHGLIDADTWYLTNVMMCITMSQMTVDLAHFTSQGSFALMQSKSVPARDLDFDVAIIGFGGLGSELAKAARQSSVAIIKVATEQERLSAECRRFTLAKELYHLAIDGQRRVSAYIDDVLVELTTKSFWATSEEILANRFAAELLTPSKLSVPVGYPTLAEGGGYHISRRVQKQLLQRLFDEANVPDEFDATWLDMFKVALADELKAEGRWRFVINVRVQKTAAPSTRAWVQAHLLQTGVSPPKGIDVGMASASFASLFNTEHPNEHPHFGCAPARNRRLARLPRPSGRTLSSRLPCRPQAYGRAAMGRFLHAGCSAFGRPVCNSRPRQVGVSISLDAWGRRAGSCSYSRLMRFHVQ
jgi:hypothetical protein